MPGQEDEVRALMARYLAPYGELVRDNLGGIAVRKVGRPAAETDGPRVLIAGHMDEVGYMVTADHRGGLYQVPDRWAAGGSR